jgi:hypothetical protein
MADTKAIATTVRADPNRGSAGDGEGSGAIAWISGP